MTQDKSDSQDYPETRPAKAAEMANTSGQVWEEVRENEATRDDKIVRLKAERLARDADDAAARDAAKSAKLKPAKG